MVYTRVETSSGKLVEFVVSKTRVGPAKGITIPRLEWALSKTMRSHTTVVYYPFYERYTFISFLHRIRDILTGV